MNLHSQIEALLVYHYLLTVDEEIHHYGKASITGSSVLYIANRYLSLASTIYNAASWWLPFHTYLSEVELGT